MKEKQQHITDRNESGLSNLTDEELWVSSAVADDTQQYDVDQAFERFRKRCSPHGTLASLCLWKLKDGGLSLS